MLVISAVMDVMNHMILMNVKNVVKVITYKMEEHVKINVQLVIGLMIVHGSVKNVTHLVWIVMLQVTLVVLNV